MLSRQNRCKDPIRTPSPTTRSRVEPRTFSRCVRPSRRSPSPAISARRPADFTVQRELQQTTQQLLEREAAQIEAAMRARDKGTYGTCQECGSPIPAERLEARPEATTCVDCQRRVETGRAG